MKKITTLTLIMCIVHSTTSLCMLRRIACTKKTFKLVSTRHYHGRPYYIKSLIPLLPQYNIFNTPNVDQLPRSQMAKLVHDLFDRNVQFKDPSKQQEHLLEQQEIILAGWMTGDASKLDIKELQNLEEKLRATFQRYIGHADE